MNENTFAYGVVCFSRNCQAAVELVQEGKWTLARMMEWLVAVEKQDASFVAKIEPDIIAKLKGPS